MMVNLKDIAEFRNGLNYSKADVGRGCKIIGVADFGERVTPDYSILQEVHNNIVHQNNLLADGDILFVRSNGNKALVGRSMFIRDISEPVTFAGFCIRLRILNIDTCLPEYLALYCRTNIFRLSLSNAANGANIQNLSQDILGRLSIDLPSIDKQRRIADILTSYDDLIENNQRQIKLLEEAAMRLYKEWFVNLRFPGYEKKLSCDASPLGWYKKELHEIADIIMGQSPKSEAYNAKKIGLPFHQGVTNYGHRFVSNDVYTTEGSRIANAGSILFSVRAPVGRLNITTDKIVIGRGLAAVQHKQGYQSYLFYMLKERFFKDNLIGNGSIYASITKDDLYRQSFIVPTDGTDKVYNELITVFDKEIENLDKKIFLICQARDKLLPKLMSGEIEV